jgi:hypothetical protein
MELPWEGVHDPRDDTPHGEHRSPAERLVAGSLIDESGVGKPLRRSTLQRARSVESYLRGDALPRYIRRAAEIERGIRGHEAALAEARAAAADAAGGDSAAFAERWTRTVRAWDFEDVNELVRQHNAWYPVERDLPMDPRTGDYVLVSGRSYRREELDADWALRRFPPALGSG